MFTRKQLYDRLESVSRRHSELKARFDEMHGLVQWLATDKCPIKGITLSEHVANNAFDVAFGGRIFRFVYSLSVPGKVAGVGLVTCYAVDPSEMKSPVEVAQFSFDHGGTINLRPPDAEDPVGIDTREGACYAVLHCVYAGVAASPAA